MFDYTIDKNKQLTIYEIQEIINNFELTQKPILTKWKNYYDGKQDILLKTDSGTGKPNNKLVVNYCNNIADNYSGYMAGIPVSYSSKNNSFEEVQQILNYNDVKAEDSDLLTNALIYGKSFEIMYLDEDIQTRFALLNSAECIPVYSNTVNGDLLYLIRYYPQNQISYDYKQIKYNIDVYDSNYITHYIADNQLGSMQFIGSEQHYFGQVPIIVLNLNNDRTSIFDKIMTLQDAYNLALSDTINDWDSFCDAYMVLKGGEMSEEDLALLKEKRMIRLDGEDSVSYLTKQVNDAQIQNILKGLNDQIHKISASPDFNDEKFLAASGISMKYKLCSFENVSSKIESNWKKALQKRLELICAILNLTGSDSTWRDIDIRFTRNLPVNLTDSVNAVNQLRGIVSDKTLLSLLPFITDPQAELDQVQAEQQNKIDMYGFDTTSTAGGTTAKADNEVV